MDFFSLDNKEIQLIKNKSLSLVKSNKTILKYSKVLNNEFSYIEKVDFIKCIYEVAFIDNNLDYIENHTIKNISNALNVEHSDLIKAKIEIKQYLD